MALPRVLFIQYFRFLKFFPTRFFSKFICLVIFLLLGIEKSWKSHYFIKNDHFEHTLASKDRFRFRPVPVHAGSGSNRFPVNRTRFPVPGLIPKFPVKSFIKVSGGFDKVSRSLSRFWKDVLMHFWKRMPMDGRMGMGIMVPRFWFTVY